MRFRNVVFISVFLIAAVIASQVNFSAVVGAEGQSFTLFQLLAPTAGAFLGPLGILVVLASQAINFVVLGKEMTFINAIRFLPMLFAVYYFSRKRSRVATIFVPVACMALFWVNPLGRTAWVFALFWTIPVIAHIFPNSLLWKSFGATFTAHAVGSTIWLYTVPMPAATWITLIPQVMFERSIFALGMAGSYWGLNVLLNLVEQRWKIPVLQVEKLPWLDKLRQA